MQTTATKSLEPFRGTVNVMFRDAMIASTDRAIVVKEPGRASLYYIPFDHIYFEFLKQSPTTRKLEEGEARFWNVSAVGESADDVMWAFDAPAVDYGLLRSHGAFDSDKVTVEAIEEPDTEHRVHWPR
ncbi:DUF427 domain-containing protein [Aquibium sp. LZ166]|uniref:DUF427 domain-containing protein n=1 Tax=Aquibium pacificus TaxID=3153579 RepID=A0ABV3SHU7_9HYPH